MDLVLSWVPAHVLYLHSCLLSHHFSQVSEKYDGEDKVAKCTSLMKASVQNPDLLILSDQQSQTI